ncbi:MAG: hypothetical protein EOS70_15120 [Mesorhizobium sp.]|uniref:hypothetical protein n=1 Tax=Mesorhizobium sp. TaxID=1871066 RepID=UPI000FE87703|nr:hypothetical protein [Mesorhizobium sp.]RWC33316.1 MAG: hypothetical protein EOS70_15120 [Mesorhizobium sp.]
MIDSPGDCAADFDAKLPDLLQGLQDWFEKEAASIDDIVANSAPSGTGGSIISGLPAIDSKRIVDATMITEEVLGIELPPEIIKAGGYETFEEMVDHLIPLLKQVYCNELKIKKTKKAKAEA